MSKLPKILLILTLPLISFVQAQSLTPSPEGAEAYIISPKNGDKVNENITVKFGLKNMGVAPAGINKKSTGHHHLLIDGNTLPAFDKPMGKGVMHFGGGQTEIKIKLSEGEHTLQLILGDHRHIPHNPSVVSERITIYVK